MYKRRKKKRKRIKSSLLGKYTFVNIGIVIYFVYRYAFGSYGSCDSSGAPAPFHFMVLGVSSFVVIY